MSTEYPSQNSSEHVQPHVLNTPTRNAPISPHDVAGSSGTSDRPKLSPLDYASSANESNYFNPGVFYSAEPNGSEGDFSRHHSFDSSAFDGSTSSQSEYGGNFSFSGTYGSSFMLPQSAVDEHNTPPGQGIVDDDRTPVVSDARHPIHPSDLPSARASSSTAKPLLSPFRSFGHQQQHQHDPAFTAPASMTINDPNMFADPSQYYHSHQQYAHHDPAFNHMQMQPQYSIGQPMSHSQHYPTQPQYDFGPPRSRHGSPTGSVSSSIASSLARSASTSSELRPVRVKVKLTREDKRNIVELHKTNTSLRQEDIARQYGVDRSTISKIIISAHRWTASEEVPLEPVIRQPKSVGGRFPAVEEKMSEWMDRQIAAGLDVRDNVARDQAKMFAQEVGLGNDRFKASAKWLDKFKDRRKQAGKPVTSSMHFGYYPYGAVLQPPYQSPIGSGALSRSHSAVTLSSSGSSSQEAYIPSPACIPADRMVLNRSEPDLLRSAMNSTPTVTSTPSQNRARSQSSPHTLTLDGPMQTPSSGKAVRPSPLTLQRQNSYHGTSPSPRRPAPPSRANSSQGPFRRSRPGSLAASAFGITPIEGSSGLCSPLASPTSRPVSGGSSAVNAHARHRSEACLTPFTASMQGMTISPDGTPGDLSLSASTSSVTTLPMPMSVPPLTPITPGHVGNSGVFPNLTPEFGDFGEQLAHLHHQPQQYYHPHPQQHMQQWQHWDQQFQAQQFGMAGMPPQTMATEVPLAMPVPSYATMPNKHFGMEQYEGYQSGDYGQAFPVKQEQQDQKWQ